MASEYKKNFVQIDYLEKEKILKCVWLTPPTSKEMREAQEFELELTRKYKVNRLFYDPTHLGALSLEDQKWLNEYYIDTIIKERGSVKIANLVPTNVFTELSLEEVLTSLPTLTAQFFDDETKALKWLADA